jgi:hypothetical protein
MVVEWGIRKDAGADLMKRLCHKMGVLSIPVGALRGLISI